MARITGFHNYNPYYSTRFNSMMHSSRLANLPSRTRSAKSTPGIQNSAYAKLLKSYYGRDNASKRTANTNSSSYGYRNGLETITSALSSVRGDAEALGRSADKLASAEKGNVFEKKSVKQPDGLPALDYDRDAIYSAVNRFVEDYNDTLKNASTNSDQTISNAASSMARNTSFLSKSLEKIGITAGKNGQLALDKDAFQKADMDTVKSLFQGAGSYGNNISYAASRIQNNAERSLSSITAGIYTQNAALGYGGYGSLGGYGGFYGLGSFFNGYF